MHVRHVGSLPCIGKFFDEDPDSWWDGLLRRRTRSLATVDYGATENPTGQDGSCVGPCFGRRPAGDLLLDPDSHALPITTLTIDSRYLDEKVIISVAIGFSII